MNTILVRLTPDIYERAVPMAAALADYYDGRLRVNDCLEFTTEDPAIAAALRALFDTQPEPAVLHTEDVLFDREWQRTLDEACDRLHLDTAATPEEHAAWDAELDARLAEVAAEDVHDRLSDNTTEDLLQTGVETTDPEPHPARKTVGEILDASKTALPLCVVCHQPFQPARKDSLHCGKPECKKAAYAMKARERKNGKSNGNGYRPKQVRKWLIARDDQEPIEVDEIRHLLDKGKVAAGQRVHKKDTGWFVVVESGGTMLLRPETNGHAAQ